MSIAALAIRTAKPSDCHGLARVHDASWRFAYQGVLPGRELERMIARRGPDWWERAVRRRVPILVLESGDDIRGYITFGLSRISTLPFQTEIYELYIQPEYAGLGFGKRLFRSAQQRLVRRGHDSLVVWCLSENGPGCAFYERMGGRIVATSHEMFGDVAVGKVAFGFDRLGPTTPRLPPS
ncbi:GNAT family N-acetyltransferase [Acuticoccus sp. M5D2P5]|uniref:GNAT family N-acetyltransferase n=1 Tax=Acuticoccus kalidii TaxID=2910977 RepID=UPI001F1A0D53|nr:GNAT family N-acetyltransferase [Acuticoccus kalidii]MCF3936176.1 GNAT family N-acetyltransferase [Acuticoccus kalidii]